MGTITRGFANNITTSGVLLPASLNNNSIANVTAYNASVPTGNMVLISSQTASNSASISFTTGIDSTYKEYQFWFINIHPQTDGAEFEFNMSTDGGSNYNVIKTTTYFSAYHAEADDTATLNYQTSRDLAQSTSFQNLGYSDSNNDDASLSGTLQLFNPSSTTYVKHFISANNVMHAYPMPLSSYVAGYFNTTSAINAIQFRYDSGNIDDGIIKMYGVKKS